MTRLGGLLIGFVMALGPVVLTMGLLNLRDRRESALLGAVLAQLAPRDRRSRVAVRVRCALFWRRGVVSVDLWACSREEIWNLIARLGRALPPRVRLRVRGAMDREFMAQFTVETARRAPPCQPRRRPVAV